MKNTLIISFLSLVSCNAQLSTSDIQSHLFNQPFSNEHIDSVRNVVYKGTSQLYRVDSSIYFVASNRGIHGIVYDKNGNVINADVCYEYFPDDLLERIKEKKNLKVSNPKFIDSSFAFYGAKIIDVKTGKTLLENYSGLKQINVLLFWNMAEHNAYQKVKIPEFISEVNKLQYAQVFLVNNDNNTSWNINKQTMDSLIKIVNKQ